MFDPVYVCALGVLILLAGSLASMAVSSRRRLCGWVSFGLVAASAVAVWVAVGGVMSGAPVEHTFGSLPQLGASLAFRIDYLAAIFLALIGLVAPASTLYSIRYMEHYSGDKVAKFYPVLLLAIAGMVGVVLSADFVCFLVFWELMTLASYFLVIYERESAASQRAGLKYFVITHGATLSMIAAALLLWRSSGSFHFDAARTALAGLFMTHPFEAHLVTFLFFIGFATKAGILPMGDWLPDAHPVAPSGMSALLSGVLVKLGIYGLLRLFCSFIAPSPALAGWGIVLALAGAASLFVANLTAVRQNDAKRLMAFSTIGQVGYICLGLGAGAYGLASMPSLAAICLAGAMLHAINHACFKSCLFLGAGSVLYRTGTRDMDRLGGLGQFMPYTAGSTVVASLSIAGVPPFSGFTSKWLIIAGCILTGLRSPLFLILGLVALFVSIVSLASFLKLLGGVFLGKADENVKAAEVPASMIAPQAALAALCIVLGVFPQLALRFIRPAVEAISGVPLSSVAYGSLWGGMSLRDGAVVGSWWPLAIAAGLAGFGLISYGIGRLVRASIRSVPVWYCGEEHTTAEARYRASSFFLPFRHAFQGVYPVVRLRAPRFPARVRRLLDFDRWLYLPTAHSFERAAAGVSRTHVGTPQIYLLWIVVGAIVVVAVTLAMVR